MSAYDDPPQPFINRTSLIACAVVAFHVLALWGLQSGLLLRAVEIIVPVQLMTEFIETPKAKEPPPPPTPPPPNKTVVNKSFTAPPVAQTVAINDPMPAANAPNGALTPVSSPTINVPVAANAPSPAPAPTPAHPAPPRLELPSSDADYLQNTKPPYPRLSKKLNEQGTVVMRVQIGANGEPLRAEIGKSSGYERLDESAAATVMKWRYIPGKRNGVAEAMWFNVPINFVLE